MIPNVARALACARHFHALGLTPLPSRSDDKIPDLPKYTHYYEGEPVEDEVYEKWKACNIQVITGTKHPGTISVIVVDLDGEEAPDAWRKICEKHNHTPSSAWMVETGSGGTHFWYRLPPGVLDCPSGMIWGVYDTFGTDGKGGWLKHKEIRILGDRSLAMCPPSFHPKTGKRYHFYPGTSPNEIPLPEVAPQWLLNMTRLSTPSFAIASAPISRPREKLSGKHYMRGEVMAAITDKVSLAKEWGLKFDRETANASGWASCYVPWREEPGRSRPSGTMHCLDGTFQDRFDMTTLSLFDLGVQLQPGMFPKWQDCRDYCGDRFIGRIQR